MAGYDLMVCIECTAGRRPTNIEWVERMIEKHRNLPTNKLVLVSKSGFTSTAAAKAHRAGFQTFALNRAEKVDWTRVVGKLERAVLWNIDVIPTGCRATFETETGLRIQAIPRDLTIVSQDGRMRLAEDIVNWALREGTAFEKTLAIAPDDGTRKAIFSFSVSPTVFAVASDGRKHRIAQFEVDVSLRSTADPIDLEAGRWEDAQVAYGRTETFRGDTSITVIELGGGQPEECDDNS